MTKEEKEYIRRERSRIVLARAKREMSILGEYFDVGTIAYVPELRDNTVYRRRWRDRLILEQKGLARTQDGNFICVDCQQVSHPHATHARHTTSCPRISTATL